MSNEFPFELTVSRLIAAPPEKVWQVITGRLEEWWCPKPWRTEINALEWHAGGAFDTTMRGPNPEDISSAKGVMLEVIPNRRFVFTDALDSDWNTQTAFMVGIFELEPEAAGTRYTARARHWTVEAMEEHSRMGFAQGWQAVADQLAALAEA